MEYPIFFIVLTIVFFTVVAVCIKSLKKQGDLWDSFMVSIFDIIPFIVGIAMGIIVSIILNVVL